ncbi:hypothetical protein [Paenibacillus donghaensis]|uniref:Glycosyl hydrolase n=1 Tax=Paenibacillus donghaensis TaxID=414771 RepID=A0A2Z2KKC5_9BACL|nr:hypothetical protein [Paenibacillus donghaensis]ASA24685.1 hypothetical protein B9T62_30375 [Paenibacillus donghaensis]
MRYNGKAALPLLLILILLAACSSPTPSPQAGEPTSAPVRQEQKDENNVHNEQQALMKFILAKLSGTHGIYTNLLETDQSAEVATGHEVLSESSGILMRVAVLEGDEALFAASWKQAEATFAQKQGFSYRYSPKLDKHYPLNAAVDDLRLIRALDEAGQTFGNVAYTNAAKKYSEIFYENNVMDGYMYDFYDFNYKVTNEFITLCYTSLGSLRNLSIDGELRDTLSRNMSRIVQEGYLGDTFPFYETRYNYKTGEYSSEPINTVESLLSILSLAEVGLQKPASIQFIRTQVEAGTLYGQYTREGEPANDIRSTAIYAITAMIGVEIGDPALYSSSIARMSEFQVTTPGSELMGGFGNEADGQAYSFDNLMALLAYAY